MKSVYSIIENLKTGDIVEDDLGNQWLVKHSGIRVMLEGYKNVLDKHMSGATENAFISYWTTYCIELPGLKKVGRHIKGEGFVKSA